LRWRVVVQTRGRRIADLKKSLNEGPEEYHVCVGDIFDKFVVPNSILLMVFGAYIDAAKARPDQHFFILRGNHDASRDSSKVSSFDLLKLLLARYENITVNSATNRLTGLA
jgi:DNA repair exonuclease SbcCD nuclease subunit